MYTEQFVIVNSGSRGRPPAEMHHGQLRLMHCKGCTAVQMARQLGCSTSLVYKKLSMENLQLRQKFTNIDDVTLDDNVRSLHDTHSHAGVEVRLRMSKSETLYRLWSKVFAWAYMAFKVIEVSTNRKPVCDFLLVINSN